MRRVRVKICGITRPEDAEHAVGLGADAVGMVFWPDSPRVVSADRAREITRTLPPLVARVGVFVNVPAPDVADAVRRAGLDVVQLHGEEGFADYVPLGVRIMRSVSLASDVDLQQALALPAAVTPLVDAASGDLRGGTGRMADWSRAKVLSRARPIVLAGGLTSANVAAAIREVKPWAVDVSSGVEASPGVKSAERLRSFFEAVDRGCREVEEA